MAAPSSARACRASCHRRRNRERAIRVLVVDDDFRVAGLHRDIVAARPGFTALEPGLRGRGSAARQSATARPISCSSTPTCPTATASVSCASATSMRSCSRRRRMPRRSAALCAPAPSATSSSRSTRALAELLDATCASGTSSARDRALDQEDVDRALRILHGGASPSASRSATEQLLLESLGERVLRGRGRRTRRRLTGDRAAPPLRRSPPAASSR